MKRLSMATRIKGALDGWRSPLVGFGSLGGYGQGFIPKSWDWNFWQEGKDPIYLEACSAVEAGVSAYAQTVAMLPGMVWQKDADNGRTALPNSPLAKVLANPNEYQTRSDFVMNQVRALFFRGNAYAFAQKDRDGTPTALHPVHPDHVAPYVNRDTNDIFWSIAPTDLTPGAREWPLDESRLVPDEFIWHVHMATPFHPLVGVTPLASCALSIATNISMNRQTLAFLANMSRPSGTLNTDLKMSAANVDELRQRWKEHSSGGSIGGTPILTHGLKWTPLNLDAPDATLIDFYKLSIADIARALRVPLPLVGVMDQSTFNNAEVLMNFWKASGLGWLLEHLELSLDKFFGLPAGQYCEFDTDALMRSAFKDRIDALVRGVQGGVFAPNEARAMESLPRVDDGDMPRVQQQLVPLDFDPTPPAAPVAPPRDDAPDDEESDEPADVPAQLARFAEVIGPRLVQLERGLAVALDRTERMPVQTRRSDESEQRTRELEATVAQLTRTVADQATTIAAQDARHARAEQVIEDQASLIAALTVRVATIEERAPEPGPPGRDGDILTRYRGTWDIQEIYQAGDLVTAAGALFLALTLTHDWPTDDSEEWRCIIPAAPPGRSVTYRGLFTAGMEVDNGDVVTGHEGAAWIWQGAKGVSNACPGESWSLMVKQGATGRGKPGRPGADGAHVIDVQGDAHSLSFHMSDGRVFVVEWTP